MAAADYSVPLHVDCSVEYSVPAHAAPPPGVLEPLLIIHPCHFRRLDPQRRRPPPAPAARPHRLQHHPYAARRLPA